MRILFIQPCCIGDAVMATAALAALRDAYPSAHITWAIGTWSRPAIEYHPAVDAILDTGADALPVKSRRGFLRFVQQVRAGKFDLAVSFVRSPLMSAALWLSGIPQRAGIDSGGRGFGYTTRVYVQPEESRHEAHIYLDVVRALEINTVGYRANLPVLPEARQQIQRLLEVKGLRTPYIVINPAGGNNPGMMLDKKRWTPSNFAALADCLAEEQQASIVLIGGPKDGVLVDMVAKAMQEPSLRLVGDLTFPQIGALAANALLYIGNDTGLTHLAAASGAKTVTIFGPSDPKRYAPYTDNSLALWKPTTLNTGGVAQADDLDWDWERDGISLEDVLPNIRGFLQQY